MDYFTSGRVPDPGLRELFRTEHRWQRWLDVEAALAHAEAEHGIVPAESAAAIERVASVPVLGAERIAAETARTSHPLMGLITELSAAAGEPHGGWVHWGATTQNITQTGDVLILRDAHQRILDLHRHILDAAAELAVRGAETVQAGRTHGQHAVPITFGFKVAGWIDAVIRNVDRLRQLEPRVFSAMLGGAVGNFASLGDRGPAVQDSLARRLGLSSMPVPSRALGDFFAEYVCVLGLVAGVGGKIAHEVYTLMSTEVAEAWEAAPATAVGSSTMPQKRNPQLADDCIAIAARIRSLVPLALEGILHDHEVDGAHSAMTDTALHESCILAGDLLARLVVILSTLETDSARMRANLDLTGGMISAEQVMLALGRTAGRQHAHDTIRSIARTAADNATSFADGLKHSRAVNEHLSPAHIDRLLDPVHHTGLSAQIARETAHRAKGRASAADDSSTPHAPPATRTAPQRTGTP